jgi:hypothetical protein
MVNKQTVCPRHALLAEKEPDGTLIHSIGCEGCKDTLSLMIDQGVWWPAGLRPFISDEFLETMFQRYFAQQTRFTF